MHIIDVSDPNRLRCHVLPVATAVLLVDITAVLLLNIVVLLLNTTVLLLATAVD